MLVARAFLTVALLLTPCSAAIVGAGHNAGRKVLRSKGHSKAPGDEGVVKALKFEQKLLVCNAYPSNAPMTVKQNGQPTLSKEHNSVSYKACEQISTNVHSKDKLDVEFQGSGIQGTFEVGDLPDSDAELVLVVGKRDAKTPLVAFQSFAFPARAASNSAQLAVFDTYKGEKVMPHLDLKMEDSLSSSKEGHKKNKDVSEQLFFNRVYAIDEGSYVADIADRINHQGANGSASSDMMRLADKTAFHFARNTNYIVLRVGDDKQFPQSLVVFPPMLKSNAMMASPLCLALLVIGLTMIGA